MITLTDITGLAGLAFATAVLLAPLAGRAGARVPLVVLGSLFVLMLLPLPPDNLPFAAYLRGTIGDLSLPTLLLLASTAAVRYGLLQPVLTPGASTMRTRIALLLPMAAACLLYPLALGATAYDSYAWGYGEPWFVAALLCAVILAALARLPLVAPAIALAVLGWSVGWLESGNLWDYLLDPMLCIYASGRPLALTVRAWRKPAQQT